jgi:quercetin dioxygenase-like cupin family protein
MPRNDASCEPSDNLTEAVVVDSDTDRWGHRMRTSAYEVWTKVSRKDTNGHWSLFESLVPSGLAVPLHLHWDQEEWFWVVDGTFVFEVGGHTYRLSPGTSLLAPRQVPHRWKKTNDRDGRLLILVQPAERLEEFFARMAELSVEQRQDGAVWESLYADCGMELLGPPLQDSES